MSKQGSTKTNKAANKKQQEQRRQREEYQLRQQLQKANKKNKQMAAKGSPLIDMKLIQAYQFFLQHLGANGIPQANVFQFAAQSILKFEKKLKNKQRQLQSIQQYNKKVIEGPKEQKPKVKKIIKPPSNSLPFKGQMSQQEIKLLKSLKNPNKKIQEQKKNDPNDEQNQQAQGNTPQNQNQQQSKQIE